MSDLRTYATPIYEGESDNNKIYGAVALAALIAVVGGITYAMGMWNSPPAQNTMTHMTYSDVAPPPPAIQPQQTVAPAPVVPVANPAPMEMVPAQPTRHVVRHAAPIKAAKTHVRAPAAIRPAETSPVILPIAPVDPAPVIAPPTLTVVTPPAQTAPAVSVPEQPAPVPQP